jgi:hypothetical protein
MKGLALFFVLSLGMSAHAAIVEKGAFKTKEVKDFDDVLKRHGIEGVALDGIDSLASIRPELKSSFNNLTKQIDSKPEFFKNNKEAVKGLVKSINDATGAGYMILDKMGDGNGNLKLPTTVKQERATEIKQKADDILQAIEALPGALATVATGKNGDIARLKKVADILAQTNRKTLITEGVAGTLTTSATKPGNVDDIKTAVEAAMNENRTDGQKFTLRNLIEACLNAIRKA